MALQGKKFQKALDYIYITVSKVITNISKSPLGFVCWVMAAKTTIMCIILHVLLKLNTRYIY